MTPSVRLSIYAHATHSQGLAATWLPLCKEQFGQNTPAWNTRPLCCQRQWLQSRFCGGFVWILVGGVAGPGTRWIRACGAREQEQHCGMGGRTATARAWLGDIGLGTLVWGCWPHSSRQCWPSLGQGLCPRVRSAAADVPAGPAPDSPGLDMLKALLFSISECVMLCWSN